MQLNKIHIYSLSDESGVRYIGKTSYLKKRLQSHLNTARYKKTHKEKWINKLLLENKLPEMKVLFSCDSEEHANTWEIELIRHYKQFCDLVNGTNGGDGSLGITRFKGTKWSEQRKSKCISICRQNIKKAHEKRKGTFHKEETIKKMSNCKLGDNNPKRRFLISIYQYDLNGNFLQEWTCAKDAARALNINERGIGYCKNGSKLYNQSGGYIWRNFKIDKLIKLDNK